MVATTEIGELADVEAVVLERTNARPIGWAAVGRNSDGHLVMHLEASAGTRRPDKVRDCYLVVTPRGNVYSQQLRDA